MAESAAWSRRGHKGGAAATTLASGISDSSSTISCADLSSWAGLTANGPGTATIDSGLSTEEVIEFTGVSENDLTGCTRGVGGTSAAAHDSGASVKHTSSVRDFAEANLAVAKTLGLIAGNGGKFYRVNAGATDIEVVDLIIDEDDMASDSATKVPTQQSVKAYVDAEVAGASGTSALATDRAKRTAGDITLNSTSWADIDTGLDLVIPAVAGDVIGVTPNFRVNQTAVDVAFDVVSWVAGAAVNSWATDGAAPSSFGVQGWYCDGSNYQNRGGLVMRAVAAGDISGGNVTLRFQYKSLSATNRTLVASTTQPLLIAAVNFGQ